MNRRKSKKVQRAGKLLQMPRAARSVTLQASMEERNERDAKARELYYIWATAASDLTPWERLTPPAQEAWCQIVDHFDPPECKECGGVLWCPNCAAKEARNEMLSDSMKRNSKNAGKRQKED